MLLEVLLSSETIWVESFEDGLVCMHETREPKLRSRTIGTSKTSPLYLGVLVPYTKSQKQIDYILITQNFYSSRSPYLFIPRVNQFSPFKYLYTDHPQT